MASSCSTRASADSLRRSARAVGRGDWVRADAAVARQGLRAAGGARRATVPRFKASPSTGSSCAAPGVSASCARRLPRSAASLGPARSARP